MTVAVINKHNSEFAPSVSNLHVCIAGDVLECFHLFNIENVTFTSSGVGTLDGQGEVWWGIPGIGTALDIDTKGWNLKNVYAFTFKPNTDRIHFLSSSQ